MNRRELIKSAGLLGAAGAILAACGTGGALISAQALADAQGVVTGAQTIIAAIQQYAPSAISETALANATAAEAAALAALNSLNTATAAQAGATTLQTVDTDIQTVLTAIGAALPAASAAFPVILPFVPMYDAAVALLPAIETWINSVIQQTTASALKPVKAEFTIPQARAILGVPTKG
jgi:hypothetical protein